MEIIQSPMIENVSLIALLVGLQIIQHGLVCKFAPLILLIMLILILEHVLLNVELNWIYMLMIKIELVSVFAQQDILLIPILEDA